MSAAETPTPCVVCVITRAPRDMQVRGAGETLAYVFGRFMGSADIAITRTLCPSHLAFAGAMLETVERSVAQVIEADREARS